MIRFKSRDNVQGWVLLRGSHRNHANGFFKYSHDTGKLQNHFFLISRSNKVKIRKISPLSVYGAVNVHHLLI